jgi:hypothetical protein
MTKTWAAPSPRLPRRASGGLGAGQSLAGPRSYGDRPKRPKLAMGLMSLIASLGPRSSDDPRRRRHHHREARHRRRAGHRRRDIRAGHVRWRRHGEQCLRGLAHHAPR